MAKAKQRTRTLREALTQIVSGPLVLTREGYTLVDARGVPVREGELLYLEERTRGGGGPCQVVGGVAPMREGEQGQVRVMMLAREDGRAAWGRDLLPSQLNLKWEVRHA